MRKLATTLALLATSALPSIGDENKKALENGGFPAVPPGHERAVQRLAAQYGSGASSDLKPEQEAAAEQDEPSEPKLKDQIEIKPVPREKKFSRFAISMSTQVLLGHKTTLNLLIDELNKNGESDKISNNRIKTYAKMLVDINQTLGDSPFNISPMSDELVKRLNRVSKLKGKIKTGLRSRTLGSLKSYRHTLDRAIIRQLSSKLKTEASTEQ